jgi:FkbM family methyltransferase
VSAEVPLVIAVRAALLRRWPFRRGRRRLARALRLGASQIPGGRVVTAGPLGLKFRVFPDDVYFDLFYFSEYERFETAFMLERLREGGGVIDIGANFGWFTAHAAAAFGGRRWVRAFEPQEDVRAELISNLELNADAFPGDVSVECLPIAVGERAGALALRRTLGASHAYASAFAGLNSAAERLTEVRMESLDSLAQARKLPGTPAFIKCDVEGGEFAVLRGASGLCRGADRPTWLLEINREAAGRAGWQPEDMVSLLRSWGYMEFLFVSHAVRPRRVPAGDRIRLPDNGNLIARSS